MLHRLRQKPLGVYLDRLLGVVKRAESDGERAVHERAVSGMAEAALRDRPLALAPRDFGVDVDARLFLVRQLDDDEPPQLADLIRRQPDAAGGAHGVDHVVGERDEPPIHAPHALGAPPKKGMGDFKNVENGQRIDALCILQWTIIDGFGGWGLGGGAVKSRKGN